MRERDVAQQDKRHFAVGGPVWQAHKEGVVAVLAGQAAMLTQALYPGAAEGMARMSAYRDRPFRRMLVTAIKMDKITYGTEGQTQPMLDQIRELHTKVHGKLDQTAGSHQAGGPFSAMSSEAQTWVGTMFVDAVVRARSTFLYDMDQDSRDAYYRDGRGFLPLFGTDRSKGPDSQGAVDLYVSDMFATGRIAAGEYAKNEIAPQVLFQRVKVPLLPAHVSLGIPVMPLNKLTIGLLRSEVREAYEFKWSDRDQKIFDATARASQRYYGRIAAHTPSILHETPGYRRAQRELSAAA